MKKALFILVFLLIWLSPIFSQKTIAFSIVSEKNLPQKFPLDSPANSITQLKLSLKTYIETLNKEGYLSACVDSISGDSTNQVVHFFVGSKYEWTQLNTDSVDEDILTQTGFRDKQYLNKPFSPKQIANFFSDAITHLENNGYPFAEIKLGHVTSDNNKIKATVLLQKNQFYRIDSIQIIGEKIRLNQHYIENIIRVKKGHIYNESVISQISNRIQEDPYVAELKTYEVIFTPTECKIVLILKPQKANTFDGIIGFQPQDDNSKLIVTGDVKIGLGNIVGFGERLNLRWQRLRDQTQEIDVGFQVPFLFQTPIGLEYDLNIFRQDTTFNNVHHRFTIPYRLDNGAEIHGFFDNFSTSLIATSPYEGSTEIPPYNDAENKLYGLGYKANFVRNVFNPYSGWIIQLDAGFGSNKILPNSALENIVYDSIDLESSLIQGELNISYFQPITKQTTLLARMNTSFKSSDNLSENQSFRIGGFNTLRGFDEQSLFATSYAIGTLEYRLLFDKNSRLSVFYDFAWYELSTITSFKSDTPQSFGAGITFGTTAGMFSLNYALGTQLGNPINFRTGKIHFGFVNLF